MTLRGVKTRLCQLSACLRTRAKSGRPEVHDIVELGNSAVPDFGSCETSLSLDLGGEVTEEDDSGLIRSEKERTDEKIRRRKGRRIAISEDHTSVQVLPWNASSVGTH